MHSTQQTRRGELRVVVGLALLLVYALPLFVPPPTPAVVPPTVAGGLVARIFPHVPAWWVVGRLIALSIGAILIASVAHGPVVRLAPFQGPTEAPGWTRPWVRYLALVAAALQAACLPWLSKLSSIGQTLFMFWFAVPASLLAWGYARAPDSRLDRPAARRTARSVGALIVCWIVYRLVVSWHSPRAADIVDMWRVFGGFVRLTAQKASFLTASMDPDLPGENAMQLFFEGLPLLQIASHAPSLAWVQLMNAAWMGVTAATVAALSAALVGRSATTVATAAFLFSPFSLLFVLSPVPAVALLLPALLGLCLVTFLRRGSPATLACFGAVAGISLTLPSHAPMTALAVAIAAARVWKGPRVPFIVVMTALLSLVAGLGSGIQSPAAIRAMVQQYAEPHFPMAVAERALQGQLSPTIGDWTTDAPGWSVIPAGAVLSPFAIARSPLRLWGDVLFEPWSAGLSAVGLAICARHAVRNRVALALLAFVTAALLPGFVSSYDRPSLLRILGAPTALALMSAVGFVGALTTLHPVAVRRWAMMITTLAIAVSGTVLFDVVNPRILAASSIGLLVRAVDASELDGVALLTAGGRAFEPDVDVRRRHWELDWLRAHHPYVDEIVRCVPKRPIATVHFDRLESLAAYDTFFWSPAVEQTAGMTARLCNDWPDAALYTITDAAGLSRLYAARHRGPGWQPSLPQKQWTTGRCPPRN